MSRSPLRRPNFGALVVLVWLLVAPALLLALVGVPAYRPFTPGRIDHHNVQIALATLAVAATVRSDRIRWAAGAAGALSARRWRCAMGLFSSNLFLYLDVAAESGGWDRGGAGCGPWGQGRNDPSEGHQVLAGQGVPPI